MGSNGRPDIAAGHSIIAGKVRDKFPELFTLCNQIVKQVKSVKVKMRYGRYDQRTFGTSPLSTVVLIIQVVATSRVILLGSLINI